MDLLYSCAGLHRRRPRIPLFYSLLPLGLEAGYDYEAVVAVRHRRILVCSRELEDREGLEVGVRVEDDC